MLSEEICAIQLERAIPIADRQFEHQPDQHLPAPGIELAYLGVLTVDAIAQDSIVLLDERKEALQVMNIKLPIRVHKEDKLFGDRLKATDQGCPVALIDLMIDESHAWVLCDNLLHNRPCAILAAIIDHDHLKVLCPS